MKIKKLIDPSLPEIPLEFWCEDVEFMEDNINKKQFTEEDAKRIGEELGIDWSKFDVKQFCMGLNVELEHGTRDPETNVTDNDDIMTGNIALAHLNEFPDYYTRLEKMEQEAEAYWEEK